jgi:hypothetical protein
VRAGVRPCGAQAALRPRLAPGPRRSPAGSTPGDALSEPPSVASSLQSLGQRGLPDPSRLGPRTPQAFPYRTLFGPQATPLRWTGHGVCRRSQAAVQGLSPRARGCWLHSGTWTLPRSHTVQDSRGTRPPGPCPTQRTARQPWAAPAQQLYVSRAASHQVCWPECTEMQGRQEMGGESVSDFVGELGEVSHQASGGQNSDGSKRVGICCYDPLLLPGGKISSSRLGEGHPTCTTSCPDPGELSSGWGEFEGFRESSARSEQLSQSLELLERPTESQSQRTSSISKECGSLQPHRGGPWVTGTAAAPSSEVFCGAHHHVEWEVFFVHPKAQRCYTGFCMCVCVGGCCQPWRILFSPDLCPWPCG